MKLSIVSSGLLSLGFIAATTASAEQPLVFGRSMRKRSSSAVHRTRFVEEDATKRVRPRRAIVTAQSKTSKESTHGKPSSPADSGKSAAAEEVEASADLSSPVHSKTFKRSVRLGRGAAKTERSVASMNSKTFKKALKDSSVDRSAASSADLKLAKRSAPSPDASTETKESQHQSKTPKKMEADEEDPGASDSKGSKKSREQSNTSKKTASPEEKSKPKSKTSKKNASSSDVSKKSKTSKVIETDDFFYQDLVSMSLSFSMPESKTSKTAASSSDGSRKAKTSKVIATDDFVEDSFDMDLSVSFSLDYIEINEEDPVVGLADSGFVEETGPSASGQGIDFGRVAFDYLRQCVGVSNADLEYTCLVSESMDAFLNEGFEDDDLFGRLRRLRATQTSRCLVVRPASNDGVRFLQGPDESTATSNGECYPLEASDATLYPIMEAARQRCTSSGTTISDEEFDLSFDNLLRLLSNVECERSLCLEGTDPSPSLLALLFDEAAQCANVEIELKPCAVDHILKILAEADAEPQDEEPCGKPSEEELLFAVSFMLVDAAAKCLAEGVRMMDEEWRRAGAALASVFAANECWGVEDCEDGTEVSSADFSLTGASIDVGLESSSSGDDRRQMIPVITDDGRACIFEAFSEPEAERDLQLSFFYRVETLSGDGTALRASLEAVERGLIRLACSDERRRSRALEEFPRETLIVAVEAAPEDVVSTNYTCSPPISQLVACNIVEGKITIVVEGDSAEHDSEILLGAYDKVEEMFASLPVTLTKSGESNVAAVRYLGTQPPALASAAPAENTSSDTGLALDDPLEKIATDDPDVTSNRSNSAPERVLQSVFIAAAGSVLLAAVVAAGVRRARLKSDSELDSDPSDTVLDEKSHGSSEDSRDGRASLCHTADLTYAMSAGSSSFREDGSDASSIASPARSHGSSGALSPEAHRDTPRRFFVLAEEEEGSWRDLSILPQLAQDDGTLEDVSEEGEFVNSVGSQSRDSSIGSFGSVGGSGGEMSV